MNKLSFSIKFYLLKSRAKKNLYPLYCRITVNRKKSEFSLNEWIEPKKWNPEKEEVKGNPELNARIKSTFLELKDIRDEMLEDDQTPTAKEIRDKYLGKEEVSTNLLEYVNTYIDQMAEIGDRSKSTIKKYRTIAVHLKCFLSAISVHSMTLKRFNSVHVKELEYYLRTEANLGNNTTVKYLKLLKTIYNRAIEFGLVDKNPFDSLKFKYEKTNREYLTQKEVDSIVNLQLKNESLDRVRDLFLFSCYTGLRFSDVSRLTKRNIISDPKGNEWIQTDIEKTNDLHQIPLLEKAKDIITKHQVEAEITGLLLPVRSNQKVNAYLKIIADMCGIDKHLTYHMARHTFATTITLLNDTPIEMVSKMLGHKNLATTQIYAKMTNQFMLKHAKNLNEKL